MVRNTMNSKKMCSRVWIEKLNYLSNDVSKNTNEGKFRIFNESKNTYIECVWESEHFDYHKCCLQLIIETN